jgi:3-oxoacyl-[acyl-carrier protein] reductase
VNSAGVAQLSAIIETKEEDFDRLFAVNVKGLFFALQEAAKIIRDGGRIVNLSTVRVKLRYKFIL